MKTPKKFSFSDAAREVAKEQERVELEIKATRFLSHRRIARDGRPLTEQRESVRVTYHHNG